MKVLPGTGLPKEVLLISLHLWAVHLRTGKALRQVGTGLKAGEDEPVEFLDQWS